MTELEVRFAGFPVASLVHRRGTTRLTYAQEYVEAPSAVPLSLSLPLTSRRHSGRAVSTYIDNLLPDNADVRDAWAREAGLGSSNAIDLLSRFGADVAGAFSYYAHGDDSRASEASLSDEEIAELIRDLNRDARAWRGTGNHGRFSLAGAQAKTSLSFTNAGWRATTGETPSTHILKVAMPKHPDSDLIEHLTMWGARRSGIAAAETYVGTFGDEHCLVAKRFDREVAMTGQVIRVHQEDLAQALGVSRLRKYQENGGPTPEEILGLLSSNVLQWAADAAKTDFLKQLAFHWFVGNTDAHAKNYSIWLLPDRHLLTPMYDAVSFLPYLEPRGGRLEDAMDHLKLSANVGTSYRTRDAGCFEWEALARKARLPSFDFIAWMRGTIPIVVEQIVQEGERLLADFDSPAVRNFVERIQLRERRALSQLE